MNRTVALPVRTLVVAAVGIAILGGALAAVGFAVGFNRQAAPAAVIPETTAQAKPATPNKKAEPSTAQVDDKAYEPNPDDVNGYRCKAGYTPIQVPVGKTIQASGAIYEMKETRLSFGDQESVAISIQLPQGVSAPVMIINTSAHTISPEIYEQKTMELALAPGASGSYAVRTLSVVDNYEEGGITDITMCTK